MVEAFFLAEAISLQIHKFAFRGILNIALIKCHISERIILLVQSSLLDAHQYFLTYGIETQTNKLKLTVANFSLLSDFCH